MKPLIVLLITFTLTLLALKLKQGNYNFTLSARIAFSIMLLFTAMGHFMFADGMAKMIPAFLPFKITLVYFTGIIEILAAFALHIPQLRVMTGWLLILFFLLILPANIKASVDNLNFQTGTNDGHGILYLWFRVPLQILFIAWVYLSSINHSLNQ